MRKYKTRLMKFLLTIWIAMILFQKFPRAQDTIGTPVSRANEMPRRSIDSFEFCGIRYKIPRDCNNKRQVNCCAAEEYAKSGSLSCYNGVSLFWTYFPNESSLKQNFESRISNNQKEQIKTFSKLPVTCYLMGEKVEAYKMSYENFQGFKWESVFTYNVINGRYVLIELMADAKQAMISKNISYGIWQFITVE